MGGLDGLLLALEPRGEIFVGGEQSTGHFALRSVPARGHQNVGDVLMLAWIAGAQRSYVIARLRNATRNTAQACGLDGEFACAEMRATEARCGYQKAPEAIRGCGS
jgi:hypothetical protein